MGNYKKNVAFLYANILNHINYIPSMHKFYCSSRTIANTNDYVAINKSSYSRTIDWYWYKKWKWNETWFLEIIRLLLLCIYIVVSLAWGDQVPHAIEKLHNKIGVLNINKWLMVSDWQQIMRIISACQPRNPA